MAPSGISHPPSRWRRKQQRQALLTRIKQALRELPLSQAEIDAVAPRLADGLLRFDCGSQTDSPFFDIRGKVAAVCNHFTAEGLTLPEYVRAACRYPQLFVKAPASLIANVEAVVHRFEAHGLTFQDYLQAGMKASYLFAMSPATVIANIEGVVDHFALEGLTVRQYVQAALKQPQLFAQRPSTIIRHLDYLIAMVRQGLLTFPGEGQAPPEQPLRPLFAFLSRWPMCLTLADDNYALRIRYAQVTGERPEGVKLLSLPRRRIEEGLARALSSACPGQH